MVTERILRLLELEDKLGKMPRTVIDGLQAIELMPDGKIMASRNSELIDETVIIDPKTKPEWVGEVERLKTQQEFRFLFATIPKNEFDEYVRLAQARERK